RDGSSADVYARRVPRPTDLSAPAAVEPADGAAPSADAVEAPRWTRRLIPVALALLATAAYGLLGSQQFHQLAARSWDLGIFTQLAKAYGELRAPIVPIKGDGA